MTGRREQDWLRAPRDTLLQAADPVEYNPALGPHLNVLHTDGTRWDAGAFRTWSLEELEGAVGGGGGSATAAAGASSAGPDPADAAAPTCRVEVHLRGPSRDVAPVEVSRLQAACSTRDRAMFQVASNFNCLEVPGVSTDPERGDFVTNLMVDATQGPAASGGAAAAAITRAHAAFYDPSTAPADWGQTLVSGDRPPPCRLAFHNIPQTLPTCTVLGSWLWVRYRVGYIFTRDVCVCVCASHGHCHGHCAVCVVVVCQHRQVELLGDPALVPHFPVRNGKLFPDSTRDADARRAAVWYVVREAF